MKTQCMTVCKEANLAVSSVFVLKTSILGIWSESSAFRNGKLEIAILGKFRIVNVLKGRTAGRHVHLFTNCCTLRFCVRIFA